MSSIRSSYSDHDRIAREAYVRARADASALAPAANDASIGRLPACAGAAVVAAVTSRAEMDTARSEDALMASMRADSYEAAWYERSAPTSTHLCRRATRHSRFCPLRSSRPSPRTLSTPLSNGPGSR